MLVRNQQTGFSYTGLIQCVARSVDWPVNGLSHCGGLLFRLGKYMQYTFWGIRLVLTNRRLTISLSDEGTSLHSHWGHVRSISAASTDCAQLTLRQAGASWFVAVRRSTRAKGSFNANLVQCTAGKYIAAKANRLCPHISCGVFASPLAAESVQLLEATTHYSRLASFPFCRQ